MRRSATETSALGPPAGLAAGGRILLVEDDPDWSALASEALVEAGFRVDAFSTPAELLATRAWPGALCLLLDVHLPGMDGVELLRELRSRGIRLPAVMMTAFADLPLAVRAMREGAVDFVEKPFTARDLAARVAAAVARARAQESPEGEPGGGEAAERLARLSPRERQVLELVVAGLSNKQVASRLELSIKTVEVHRSHLMQKMRAGSLAELVRLALRAGMAVPEAG